MTPPLRRQASRWRRAEPFRQRSITVVALEDDFSGALDYALRRAMEEPAAVRAVRVQPVTTPGRVQPPIPVRNLTGDRSAALRELRAQSDLMVVQHPANGADSATRQILAELRRGATNLLVEVDDQGEIVRVSGSEDWSYSAVSHPDVLTSGIDVTVLPTWPLAQVGTDQASRVPPPGA